MLFVDYALNHELIFIKKDVVIAKEEGIGKVCSLSPNEHMVLVGLSIYSKIGRDNLIISPKDIYKSLTNKQYDRNKEKRIETVIIEGLQGLHNKSVVKILDDSEKLRFTKEVKIDISNIQLKANDSQQFYALHFKEVEKIMNHNSNFNRANLLLLFAIMIDALNLHDNSKTKPLFRLYSENDEILGMNVSSFNGIYSWYSQVKLAHMVNVDVRTIREYLGVLQELALIYLKGFTPYYDSFKKKYVTPNNWVCRYQHKNIIEKLASVKTNQRNFAVNESLNQKHKIA